MATSLKPAKTKTEELIEQSIAEAIEEIGNEIYRFNEASELKIYLENKFGLANVREMIKVLTDEIKDELCSNEQKLADVYEVLKDTKIAFNLLIPEPVTLAWNTDQLPERLTPKEKDFIVGTYNELMGTKI